MTINRDLGCYGNVVPLQRENKNRMKGFSLSVNY